MAETFPLLKNTKIDTATYTRLYEESINDPETFWAQQGKRLDWIQPYTKIKNTHYIGGDIGGDSAGDVSIRWYEDGTLNACVNCVDRHLPTRADKVAIIWEGDDPADDKKITYRELHTHVCRLANVLKREGVAKGDRVTIYMPMIVEAAYAMLACARIGAVHSVVFGGFSPEALAGRILDCDSTFIITADEGVRGGKTVPLKANCDAALAQCPQVKKVLVVKRTGGDINMQTGRDVWYHTAVERAILEVGDDCPAAEMAAEDPLF
ncbi:MAG: AMP-binding protein, partial [Alphaproteobacteria bacterium]|nr:AMP-binding protein [Alphaproteobacteria bacterium]